MTVKISTRCYFASLLATLPFNTFAKSAPQKEAAKKPNIVFIFADDLTIDALGFTNPELKTPNLDKLRSQGAFITHAFNQGSWNGAVSVASRTMLVTGKYLWKASKYVSPKGIDVKNSWPEGVVVNNYTPLPPEKHWSEYMKDAGYKTYFTGKWHVTSKLAPSIFDHTVHIRPGMPNQTPEAYQRKFIPGYPEKWTADDTSKGGYWKGGKHWSEVLADDAIDFINTAKKDDKPFFMELAFNAPHDPRQSPKEFLDMYPPEKIKLPVAFMPDYPYADKIGCGKGLRDERLAPFPRTPYSVQKNRQEYYALIFHLDVQVGKILKALKESGKMDNTYIFFAADHGLAVGDHGFIGKQNMYDMSMRVPMLVVGPKIKKNSTYNDMVYIQDLVPTTMDLAGCNTKNIDFHTFLPMLEGKSYKKRDAVYGAYLGLQRMVRTENYKMIIYPTINQVLLYNIKKAPYEMKNLSDEKQYKKVMDNLFVTFKKLQKEVADPLDVTKYYNNFFLNTILR